MTGPTHKKYCILFAFIATIVLYELNITHINYYLVLIIVLAISKTGALFPDVDHTWSNVHDKTVPNKIINTIIHMTGGKHRSWQTHSIDICAVFTLASYILPHKLHEYGILSALNTEVMCIIMLAFASGWISHLFSDMLTSAGVRIVCFSKVILRLVPKKIGNFRFNTGNEWEKFNFNVIDKINKVAGFICVIYPFVADKIFK